MNILTFSQARTDLKQVVDAVCEDHEPTVITRKHGKHVVMISLEDYNGLHATLYLLGTPANADRLRRSVAEFRAGKTFIKKSQTREAEKGKKQSRSGS
ncbi:type II toxin-antitoxin system Phd/YefM family antitoxin [Trinickia diaoshuihuensis]|uniref:type II toxin-antitoxin system Phd/YefM family antitoxin n=1 Tax=Trinickia diaoshuihuensis TaxID=2292265 RepID=UPI000E23279F|nr:type II toxin-antitoxin system prevent-host-death family antitoxin [Trinickia diaoshuihuensis]